MFKNKQTNKRQKNKNLFVCSFFKNQKQEKQGYLKD